MPRSVRFLLIVLVASVPLMRAAAQAKAETFAERELHACNGERVSAIEVHAQPPSYNTRAAGAYETMEHVVGIHHATTRESVVRSYLRVKVGQRCTERSRSESERLLRAQPFIALASVRAFPDGEGQVRLHVDVVDEIALIGGGSTSRGTISSLALGSQNIAGLGLGALVSFDRGFAYRNGIGARVIRYGAFGAPDYVAVAAQREQLGEALSFEVSEPFLTDLARRAFHIGASEASSYYGVIRPAGDFVSLYTRRVSYDAGWVTRIGEAEHGHTVGLLGGALLGEDIRVGARGKIVSDTGLINAPPDNTIDGRYRAFAVTRVAAIAGLRALRFVTVHSFDALRAPQDVGVGVQLDVLAGPSVWASRNESDFLVAGDLYAGAGNDGSFFSTRLLGEARGNHQTHSWDGLVGSARFAWYTRPSDLRTRILSLEASTIQHLAFPLQLTFRDADAGLPGFPDATAAGGQRVIARIEERRLVRLFPSRIDFAFAAFADAGKLWAGDVPYGASSPVRASVGISLLGAYPSGGKRTLRADLAIPINPERGGARYELRFSDTDHTRLLWFEPRDVARARSGAVPANLMRW